MSTEFNFGPAMSSFGRDVLRELARTDFGPQASFDGIGGHAPRDDHHGGMHDQINVWKSGQKDSGVTFRFFDE